MFASSNDNFQQTTCPPISVVVCSKNRPAELVESCISHIQRSTSRTAIEIIVVDGNQAPALQQVAYESGAGYVHETRSGMGIARNAGIRAATARIVAFTDDDCEPSCSWARQIIEKFRENQELTFIGGIDLTPKDSSFFQKGIGLLDDLRGAPGGGPGLARRITNCNVAYVKKALVDCGGYDETFEICEDQELHLRLFKMGHRFFFNRDLVVYHKRRNSIGEFWRQFFRYGYWSSKVFRKHPELFARTAGILPSVGIVVFLLSLALALSAKLYAPFALTILAVLAYEVIWCLKISFMRPDAWRSLPLAVLALLIRNIAMGLGFLTGMICYFLKLS